MSFQLPQITTEENKEQFEDKMQDIALKQKEADTQTRASMNGLPYIQLKGFPISAEALTLIPEKQARDARLVCFFYIGDKFSLGTIDPNSPAVKEILYQLEERTKAKGTIYLISENSLEHGLLAYSKLPKITPARKGVTIAQEDLQKFKDEYHSFDDLQKRIEGTNITDMVVLLIASAMQSSSSDIHIEAGTEKVTARFRIDGVLHAVADLKKTDWPKIISRIKLLSGLKINITDRPQDGRFTIHASDGEVEVRVSIIPAAEGESVVMRLMRSTAVGLKFEDLGLRGTAFEQLKKEIERPNGMIVTTGPTGSGKTTTLYAVLSKLNKPETKIITLEDPIEYKLQGVIQSQIDSSKDYSFAKGLYSILRQDPDVIMVGEIRDMETADSAIQAALTGHLVLSTIHTNSASGAIPRFLALGSKPFLLAPALNAVLAQRLVRKIHEDCKEEVQLDAETLERVKQVLNSLPIKDETRHLPPETLKFYKGRVCEKCFVLGYKGQVGIFEIMVINKEIESAILSGKVSEYTLQEIAVKNGMITMVQDGLLKALDGITSVEEVFKVAE